MMNQNGGGDTESMQIEFPSLSEESRSALATLRLSPPSSPWLDNFCYSHAHSQIEAANYFSDHEFPLSPLWDFCDSHSHSQIEAPIYLIKIKFPFILSGLSKTTLVNVFYSDPGACDESSVLTNLSRLELAMLNKFTAPTLDQRPKKGPKKGFTQRRIEPEKSKAYPHSLRFALTAWVKRLSALGVIMSESAVAILEKHGRRRKLKEAARIPNEQTPEVSRDVMMIPNSLEQSSMEDEDDLTSRDVGSSDERLGPMVNLHDDLTLQSIQTPGIVTETRSPDSLEQPTMESIIKVGDFASSSQSLAAVTVADKQSKRKISFRKGGRPKKLFSLEVLCQYSSKTLDEAASSLGVGKSSLKRRCRELGISHWSELKDKNITASPPKRTKMQDVRVAVKATYKGDTTKFKLFSSSKMVDLEEKLAHKLKLKVGSFKIKYEDEEKDKILVSTDSDVEECIITSESQGNTTIRLLVEPITT